MPGRLSCPMDPAWTSLPSSASSAGRPAWRAATSSSTTSSLRSARSAATSDGCPCSSRRSPSAPSGAGRSGPRAGCTWSLRQSDTFPGFPTPALMARTEEQGELWGSETAKAVANFRVSGEPIPAPVARWLGRIKGAAARVNAELGLLDGDKAERIAAAAARIAAGELDDQFPIDVFQTGSGTSSNMNANEVIATLAGEDVHANDDVNMGQSSNDVFPSAVHLAALDEITNDLLPAMESLAASLEAKAQEFADVVKSGRTHWMDAVPVTLGQEFAGYAAQVRQGIARVCDALPRLGQIPLRGTATGTGLNTHPEFAARGRELLARNILDSVKLLASACRLFAEKCVDGIEANRENCERYAELTLSAATALNPYIGYDRATEIVKEAAASGRSLREVAREKGVEESVLDEALDYRKMAKPKG